MIGIKFAINVTQYYMYLKHICIFFYLELMQQVMCISWILIKEF